MPVSPAVKSLWGLLACLCLGLPALAQEAEPYAIGTDRPSFGYASSTVPARILQAEWGYFHAFEQRAGNSLRYHNVGNLNLRYGLSARTEARLGWGGWAHTRTEATGTVASASGRLPLVVGVKHNFHASERLSLGALADVSLPFSASQSVRPDGPSWQALGLWSATFGALGAFGNLGYQHAAGSGGFFGALGLSASLAEPLSAYVEVARLPGQTLYLNAGTTCRLGYRHQLDFAYGLQPGDRKNGFLHLGWSFYIH